MAKFEVPVLIFELPTKEEWKAKYPDGYTAHLAYTTALRIYWRTRLGESQNWRCCWCGVRMKDERNHKYSSSIEHITPRSKGGKNHPENYAVACNGCNSSRGVEEIDVFLERIQFVNNKKQAVIRPKRKLSKVKRRLDAVSAFEALKKGSNNPFDQNTRLWNMFERYKMLLMREYDNNVDYNTNLTRVAKLIFNRITTTQNVDELELAA